MGNTSRPTANPYLAILVAWLFPGAGHAVLGRWGRAGIFAALVLAFALLGCQLDGRLYTLDNAQRFLHYVAVGGAVGIGPIYFVLDQGIGYHGDPAAPGYEYGTAFLITASLMGWLLILDVWDIARGLKE